MDKSFKRERARVAVFCVKAGWCKGEKLETGGAKQLARKAEMRLSVPRRLSSFPIQSHLHGSGKEKIT